MLRPLTVTGGAWVGVSLRRHNLAGLDLRGVDLRDADLSMADLTGTVLTEARLHGATVREADLTRADLRRASLDRVDLTAATLKGTRIDLQAAVMLAELPRRGRRPRRLILNPGSSAPPREPAGS